MKRFLIPLLLLTLCGAAQADYGVSKFTNPICGAADPCIVKCPEGKGYWYVYSNNTGIYSEYALTPADFKHDYLNKIFGAKPGSDYADEFWAPELHRLGGKWYIYFTASSGEAAIHRMYVVSGDDPMKPFGDIKCMGDCDGDNAIDQTVFEYKGKLYTSFSARVSDHQKLMLGEMASPWEIKGKPVCISHPEYEWEKACWPINEGPWAVERGGKLCILFSASAANMDEYCTGILTFAGGDIMDPKNWKKHPEPILKGQGNIQGTGHGMFTKDADGNDWFVFHCNRPHDGKVWAARFLGLQPVVWIDDIPHFSPAVEKPKYFKYEK